VVGIANNGLEAVDLAERLRPNVILMDLSMPYLDGLEATQLIRSRESAAAVVLMATATDPTLWHQARQAGAVALIEKGAPGTELAQVIRSVLQSKP
jgi:DNA-binding NarL/FixJ family response regulator